MQKNTPVAAGEDQTPCNCLALRQAARHLTLVYDRYLAEAGLRTTQYSILSKLGRLGPLQIGELAETMVMERTALSRALKPLERDRLVVIDTGPDARTRSVSLTAKGKTLLKEAAVRWRQAQKEFERGYGADAAQALRSSLRRVVEAT